MFIGLVVLLNSEKTASRTELLSPHSANRTYFDISDYHWNYISVIDLGSAGSRITLYQYLVENSSDHFYPPTIMPCPGHVPFYTLENDHSIKRIGDHVSAFLSATNQTSFDISSLLSQYNSSISLILEPLITYSIDAIDRLNFNDQTTKQLLIYATGGLRSYNQQTSNIVLQLLEAYVNDAFNDHYSESEGTLVVKLLSGSEEAQFNWMSVQQLQQLDIINIVDSSTNEDLNHNSTTSQQLKDTPLELQLDQEIEITSKGIPIYSLLFSNRHATQAHFDKFVHSPDSFIKQTIGVLDMGGSSIEIAFEPMNFIPEYNTEAMRYVSLYQASSNDFVTLPETISYPLYAMGYEFFGINSARFLIENKIIFDASFDNNVTTFDGYPVVQNPCGTKNSPYQITLDNDRTYILFGTGNTDACQEHIKELLRQFELPLDSLIDKMQKVTGIQFNTSLYHNPSESSDLWSIQTNCADKDKYSSIGCTYQPPIDINTLFIATDFFDSTRKFYNLTYNASPQQLLDKSIEFCSYDWIQADDIYKEYDGNHQDKHLPLMCFAGLYVTEVLRTFNFSMDSTQIAYGTLTDTDIHFSWPLGAALNRLNQIIASQPINT